MLCVQANKRQLRLPFLIINRSQSKNVLDCALLIQARQSDCDAVQQRWRRRLAVVLGQYLQR